MNREVQFEVKEQSYTLSMGLQETALPFEIELLDFERTVHPGTSVPRSYQSRVRLTDGDANWETIISMNEPLYHNGFTFYQSSFQEDEMGRPTMSILSVNRDPGRFWKYLGSLLIVFGIIHLFYFKGRKARK